MINYSKIFDAIDALAASTGEVLPLAVVESLAADVANVFERYGVTVSEDSEADRAADEDATASAGRLQA